MFTVVICAFSILGILLSGRKSLFLQQDRPIVSAVLTFLALLFSTLLFSGAPFDQQFWGYFGRNTGVLTYVSFALLLLGAITLRNIDLYAKIDISLIAVSVPVSLYCLIQISGNDPVAWSQFDTFATLGNINFLSGFLGLVCVSILARVFAPNYRNAKGISLALVLVADLAIIWSTGSIQGIVIFIFGVWFVLFMRMRTLKFWKIMQFGWLGFAGIGGYLGVLGLVNKGPLAGYLYQPSNILRADYMHAGWQMTTDHPIFGVGMDSYGDWYRQARGEITTLRGSADRNSNAAHSVFLDISSNGGFPLLISYVAILLIVATVVFRTYRALGKTYDPLFVSLAATWLAFNFQALISINQIGVAVWGWILSGCLYGYSRSRFRLLQGEQEKSFEKKKLKGKLLPAQSGLLTFATAFIGLVLAGIPQQADSKYFTASKARDLETIASASSAIGATAWHRNLAIDFALSQNNNVRAIEIAKETQADYPNSFFPWKLIYLLPESQPSERAAALVKIKELDPFNPEFNSP
jgi:O-antigen ligase